MATHAVLTIDLDAIVGNWRDLSVRHLQSGRPAPVAAVLKADAYGLGAAPIGRALREAGCRHFFVAHCAEGIALRAALGAGPMIAVLNGFAPSEVGDAALVPVLNSLADLAAHAATLRRAPAILHLDTGMRRLGLDAREQAVIAAEPGRLAELDLLYVMTHLACADEAGHPLNAAQAARFAEAAPRLAAGAPRSLANSAGLFLGEAFASDLARPGAALFGLNPTPGRPNPMRSVVRLSAPILQVRQVAAGDSVGYGAAWVAPAPARIATVAAGYADGYMRSLSGRAVGRVAGRVVPLVGRVSMDLTTFDVSDVPEAVPGAMVVLIGAEPGIMPDDLAERAGTIGYELLTALGARYRRDYRPAI
jgi:alanine racemase